ncbi:MAG: hypothetical protein PWP37_421 [Thermotogota bacterium]|nr:hypothetical protein [Thermotogota bacterium]MDK2864229.1 hypothetical protein [Thermotogota bacterium]HCZ07204.1 hypothetical protein [Thermotogota bacterium]
MRYNESVYEKTKNVLGWLGIAKRAGKLVWGKDRLRRAIRSRRVALLLFCSDTGGTIKNELIRRAGLKKIPFLELREVTKGYLGKVLGSTGEISVVGVVDTKIAERISKILRGDGIGT